MRGVSRIQRGEVEIPQVHVGFCVIGVELHGAEEFLLRLCRLLQPHQNDPEVIISRSVAGSCLDGFIEMGLGFFEFVFIEENPPQIIMGFGITREYLQRPQVGFFCLGDSAQLSQCGAQIEINDLILRSLLLSDQEILQRLVEILLVIEEDRFIKIVIGRTRFKDVGFQGRSFRAGASAGEGVALLPIESGAD